MKICHIADVHFRGLERHEEYVNVFDHLVDDAVSQGVDQIFIAGDIFHTKVSGITPEFIDLLTKWLHKLASVAPVHMMLGNHDGNLVNASRQDAISPIVNAINDDRIKLYKKSGNYDFAPGYEWVVYSPFDTADWDSISGTKGKISIGCFHGPVIGCLLDTGIPFAEGTNVSYFDGKGIDFVLLGDIHRHQFMGTRMTSTGVEKPWIGYPGSTVQQNYGEGLDHGWLLWDITNHDTWDVSFRKIDNPMSFVTLDWKGDADSTLENVSIGSNRIRIRSDEQLDQVDVKNAIQLLKSRGASEVAFKFEAQKTIKNGYSVDRATLRSSSNLIKLMKEMKGEDALSDAEWSNVQKYVEKLIVENSFKSAANSVWTVKKLQFDNVLSYGEGNVVDFGKLSGIVGLFGPNRIGKSSIIGSLAYALFNSSDRTSRGGDIINASASYAKASLEFERNGESYFLERQIVKGKRGTATHLNLMKGSEDLIGEQRSETDKVIRDIVGSYDDFRTTSFSTQGELSNFLTEGGTSRRSILSRFLDLDFLDQLFELVKAEHASAKLALKKFEVTNFDDQIQENVLQLQDVSNKLKDATERLHGLYELQMAAASKVPYGAKQKLELLTKSLSQAHDQVSFFESDVLTSQSTITNLQEKLVTVNSVISELNIEELLLQQKQLDQLRSNLSNIQSNIQLHEADKRSKTTSLKVLSEVPCGDSFPTCKFITNAFDAKSKIPEIDRSILALQSELTEIGTRISELNADDVRKKIEKRTKADQLKSSIENELSKELTRIDSIQKRIQTIKTQITIDESEVERLRSLTTSDDEDKFSDLQMKIHSADMYKGQLHTLIGRYEASITDLKTKKLAYESASAEYKLLDVVVSCLSKKGLPTFLISKEIPAINREISKILSGVANFDVELSIDTSGSIDISLTENGVARGIELCSGMERMITSLAIRVALTNLCAIPRSDFLVIDEGFGALDESNLSSCNRMLESLKRFYRFILIVTHVDAVKDIADQIITIEKISGKSQVNFQ